MEHVLTYPVRLDRKAEGVLATFPDFQGAITFGADQEAALEASIDCLREAIAGVIRDGELIPVPSSVGADMHPVAAPAEIAAKLAVYEAFKRSNFSKVDLAARLKLNESEVRRILDPHHRTKLDRLERAARVLGVRLQVVATAL